MTRLLHNTATVPSSILNNGKDVRAEYTRVAARQAYARLSHLAGRLGANLRKRSQWHQGAASGGHA
ncbi:MAG: hypothetical protein R3280_11410 [Marinobacter sp.]|uniref:hypothetical protein n=1 Tax=Marinobacter sp. TaxID=50741 RepID=UPI00299EF560|nr:hypothetical protein [Marinobacter sp.]MDX1635240.1 hypothetical protein [Marinobacter sp.]